MSYESNEWMKDGSCRDMPPEIFFPRDEETQDIALRACGSCAVRDVCLNYALKNRIDHGVWGGSTEEQRRQIHRAERKQSNSAA